MGIAYLCTQGMKVRRRGLNLILCDQGAQIGDRLCIVRVDPISAGAATLIGGTGWQRPPAFWMIGNFEIPRAQEPPPAPETG
jgi:hypothetical protein